MGDHPAIIIKKRLLRGSQVLVAMFWSRLGSQTPEAASGTVGEIEQFMRDSKPVLLYFCTRPIPPENIDVSQWKQLKAFEESMKEKGLMGHFETLDELDRKLKQHLSDTVDRFV